MEKIKILHTADLHIGAAESFLGADADARRFETLITAEKIIDLAIKEKVDLIAIAGDLFDSNTVEERFITAIFEKIKSAAPIKVIFAAGNHDPLNADSPFLNRSLPENLYVLGITDECITFDDINTKVYGRSFEHSYLQGEESFTIKTDENYINVLVQHGELKSDLNSDYNAITPKFVRNSGMDYIALGHVHKRTEIGKLEGISFAYCGCPEGQGFDELDQKGVYIGEVGKKHCDLKFTPVSKRLHIEEKVDVSSCNDSNEIFAAVLKQLENVHGENFRDNLYKIELTGEISEDTEIITAEILSRLSGELYFVKLKNSTEFLLDYEALANEPTLKGIFVKKMLEKSANATEEEKQIIKKALNLGLKAFKTEVKYDED